METMGRGEHLSIPSGVPQVPSGRLGLNHDTSRDFGGIFVMQKSVIVVR